MEMTTKEYLQTIEYIRQYFPDYVPIPSDKTIVLTLTVREYFEFRQIFKHEYIYFGYTRERVVIAAKKFLLAAYGY